MGNWNIIYGEGVADDMKALDGSVRPQVFSAIRKVSQNPLPLREGGYGMELGKRNGIDLTGCLKIKLKKIGVRVVYRLERSEHEMNIIVVGMRADMKVYKQAAKRLGRN